MEDANRPGWSSRSTFDFASTSTDPPYIKANGFTSLDDKGESSTRPNHLHGQEKKESHKTTRKNCFSVVKMMVVFVCIAFGTAGVVYLIINFRKDSSQETQTDRQVDKKREYTCSLESETVRFNEPLEITCKFKEEIDFQNHTYSVNINFTSDYAFLHENDTNIEGAVNQRHSQIDIWNITADVEEIKLKRTPVKCDSSGMYSIHFIIDGITHDIASFPVYIQSETSHVSLEVGRRSNTSDLYDIACSTRSECSPVPILLMGRIGDKTVPLFGSEFECFIKFRDEDGWSANCTGTMPQHIIESLSDILCTTRTGNDTIDDNKEAKINKKQFLCKTDDCVFNCPAEDGDKFYLDPTDCTVFHRCVDRRLYTRPCGKGTYFNTKTCACDHKDTVEGCNEDGMRPPGQYAIKERCDS